MMELTGSREGDRHCGRGGGPTDGLLRWDSVLDGDKLLKKEILLKAFPI